MESLPYIDMYPGHANRRVPVARPSLMKRERMSVRALYRGSMASASPPLRSVMVITDSNAWRNERRGNSTLDFPSLTITTTFSVPGSDIDTDAPPGMCTVFIGKIVLDRILVTKYRKSNRNTCHVAGVSILCALDRNRTYITSSANLCPIH